MDIVQHAVMKKGLQYNFPEKSELPKSILPVKISYCCRLFFSWFLGWKLKTCRDQSRVTFSSLRICHLILHSWLCHALVLVLQHEPAQRLINSICNNHSCLKLSSIGLYLSLIYRKLYNKSSVCQSRVKFERLRS